MSKKSPNSKLLANKLKELAENGFVIADAMSTVEGLLDKLPDKTHSELLSETLLALAPFKQAAESEKKESWVQHYSAIEVYLAGLLNQNQESA